MPSNDEDNHWLMDYPIPGANKRDGSIWGCYAPKFSRAIGPLFHADLHARRLCSSARLRLISDVDDDQTQNTPLVRGGIFASGLCKAGHSRPSQFVIMYFSSKLAGISCLSTLAAAAPFTVNTDYVALATATKTEALGAIQTAAHGSLSNITPPKFLNGGNNSLPVFQSVAFNENSEVAFFEELLFNITTNVQGFQFSSDDDKNTALLNINAIVAQEKLHQINANKAVARFSNDTSAIILPCKYNFPVTDYQSAIGTASIFTSTVMATLQQAIVSLANNGDGNLARGVASSLGQEGEQDGYFRTKLGLIAPEGPFITASTPDYLINFLLQKFIVDGSCPNLNTIPFTRWQPLTLTAGVKDYSKVTQLSFKITLGAGKSANDYGTNFEDLVLIYVNQQNTPIQEPLKNVTVNSNGDVNFTVDFPHDGAGVNEGLVLASVASKKTNGLTNVVDAAKATLFGPFIFEVFTGSKSSS
ncbi:hypothetical protein ACMFMG_006374 [Clarireedia jacksonii]